MTLNEYVFNIEHLPCWSSIFGGKNSVSAVIFDDEKQIILDRDKLSPFVKEGDAVILSDSGIYVPDKAKTEQMRNDNLSLLQKLLNK